MHQFSEADLLAYLDEMLPVERAATVEQAVRSSPELQQRLAGLLQRRDQGGHTLGEIWRRHQLSCPSRSELGGYLLGVADEAWADYIEFHLQKIGCRYCQSNLEDLQALKDSQQPVDGARSRKYFESSVGLLRARQVLPPGSTDA